MRRIQGDSKVNIFEILEKIFVFSSLARAKQNLDTEYARLEEAYDEANKEGAKDKKSKETYLALKRIVHQEDRYEEAKNEYKKEKRYTIAVAVVIAAFLVLTIAITVYVKKLPEYTSDPFNSEYVQESKKENKETSKSDELSNDEDLPYDVYVPEKESDLIWEPKTHDSGKTIDYSAFIDAYDKASQTATKTIYCESAGMDYNVTVPFQFKDKGHTFVATHSFYTDENSLLNDHECFEIYDLNDNVYYYVYNIISPYYDESGENAFLKLAIPD